jgi:hypothetical protein
MSRRSLLNVLSVVVLVTGSMAACDAVPDAADAHALVPSPSKATVALASTDAATPVVPVAGTPVLWGYVDGAGVAHFAARQIDSRYEQVLRETAGPRVPGKTQGTDGLLTWLEISPDVKALQPVLDEAAQSTGIDEALLKAVITVESNYNAHAVSPRGAVGLMQLTPVTADRYGTKEERQVPAAERMLDARTNAACSRRNDIALRYKVNGSAEDDGADYWARHWCEPAGVARAEAPRCEPASEHGPGSSATVASGASRIPFERSSRIRRFPWRCRSSTMLEQSWQYASVKTRCFPTRPASTWARRATGWRCRGIWPSRP